MPRHQILLEIKVCIVLIYSYGIPPFFMCRFYFCVVHYFLISSSSNNTLLPYSPSFFISLCFKSSTTESSPEAFPSTDLYDIIRASIKILFSF